MAEVLHDAIAQITGVPTQFTVDRRNAKVKGSTASAGEPGCPLD